MGLLSLLVNIMLSTVEPIPMSLDEDSLLIIQQLQLFSYSSDEIMKAMECVTDKTDIVAIIDYIEEEHSLYKCIDKYNIDSNDDEVDGLEELYKTKDERISEVLSLTQSTFDDEYIYLHSNIWNEPIYDQRDDERINILQLLDELNDSHSDFEDESDDEDIDDLYLTKAELMDRC